MKISTAFQHAAEIAARFYSDPLFNALECEEALLALGFHSVTFPNIGPTITAVYNSAKWTAPEEDEDIGAGIPRNEDLLREYHSRAL